MNLLAAANYDPAGAVSKVTTSLLAMTALDTTNLRLAFTVPAHGMVHVRMSGVHHGSTTTAQLFLGALEGATLRGRASPTPNLLGTAVATTRTKLEVSYTITGLTPGAVNWDAAYGVEIVSSANGAIKYGGPNDTTTDNAFGGFNFEIWDPRPFGVTQTAGDIVALINTLDDLVDTEVAAIKTETASIQSDTNDIQSRLPAALTADGNIKADTLRVGGTLQTAGDIIGDTNDIQSRLPDALGAGGSIKADIREILNITALSTQPGLIDANVTRISNDAAAADNAEAFFDNSGFNASASAIGTAAAVTTVNGLAANTVTASALAADAVTEIQSGLSTLTQANIRTAVGLASANLDTQLSGIQADTDNIQTRIPAALSGDGFMKADLKSIEDELTSSNNATLNLKKLNIVNNAGDAIVGLSTGGNGSGMRLTGGTVGGAGLTLEAAANGNGLYIQGAGATGHAIQVYEPGGNSAIDILADVGNGINIISGGDGIFIEAGINLDDNKHAINATTDSPSGGKSINAPQDIAVSDGDLTLAAIAGEVLSAATANPIDANIQEVNDTEITGDGSNVPWGPA
jgi:hypothetical protein